MKLTSGYTLKQLLEVYDQKTEIPESLANERVGIYGMNFIEAVNQKEPWIDNAVKAYLETEDFFTDLHDAEDCFKNRLECNIYLLQLECDRNKKIRLSVFMDMKDF